MHILTVFSVIRKAKSASECNRFFGKLFSADTHAGWATIFSSKSREKTWPEQACYSPCYYAFIRDTFVGYRLRSFAGPSLRSG